MADTTDVARLDLQSNAEDFERKIAKAEAALERLKAQYAQQVPAAAAVDDSIYDMADAYDLVEHEMTQVVTASAQVEKAFNQTTVAQAGHASAVNKVADATTKATKGMAGLGQAGLQTGRVIQDFAQGGIGGVLNNIEGFTQAVGGGPGLAGALTGLGVAFFLVKPFVNEFMDSMAPEKVHKIVTGMEALQEKIKEIEAKPIKAGVDLVELDLAKKKLDELTKAQNALNAAREGRTVFEKEAGEQFQQNFEEEGQHGKRTVDAMVKAEAKRREAIDPQLQQAKLDEARAREKIAAQEEFLRSGATTEEQMTAAIAEIEAQKAKLREAQTRIGAAIEGVKQQAGATIGDLFEKVGKGNDAKARADLAARFRAVGEGHLARTTELSNPEEMRRQDEIDLAAENSIEAQKEAEKLRKANQKKADAAKKKAEEALVAPARPVISAFVKGNDLADVAANDLKDLSKRGGADVGGKFVAMDEQQQLEFIQKRIKELIEGELEGRGLLNTATSAVAGTTATTVTGQAQAKFDAIAARTKAAADKHKPLTSVEKANDAEDAAIKASGIDVMTEQLLAQTRARGGAVDRNGNFQKMTPDQITAYVNRQVEKYLHRQVGVDRFGQAQHANPGMGREDTEDLAVRITSRANDRFQKDMANLGGQGLNQQQMTQRIVSDTQALLVQMANKVRRIESGNAQLHAENQRIRQFMGAPGPTNLNMGAP